MIKFILIIIILGLLTTKLMSQPVQNKNEKSGRIVVRKPKDSVEVVLGRKISVSIQIIPQKTNALSYRFYGGTLFLEGNRFVKDQYVIYELRSEKWERKFLYFDMKYYEFKPNQTKSTGFIEVTDLSILQRLKELNNIYAY